MLRGITDEEMAMLSALGKRYSDSGQDYNALTEQEWEFVLEMGNKLAQAAKEGV